MCYKNRYLYFQRPCSVPLFKRMGYVNSTALSFGMKSILGRIASGLFIQHINTVFYLYFLARCVLLQCFCKAQWSSPDFVATATLPTAMDLCNTLHHPSFLALNLSVFVVVWYKYIKFACNYLWTSYRSVLWYGSPCVLSWSFAFIHSKLYSSTLIRGSFIEEIWLNCTGWVWNASSIFREEGLRSKELVSLKMHHMYHASVPLVWAVALIRQ